MHKRRSIFDKFTRSITLSIINDFPYYTSIYSIILTKTNCLKIGGKRINYCLAKSYQSRVARAVVQYNTDGCSGSSYHKSKRSKALPLKRLEKVRKLKTRKNLNAKKSKPPRARFADREVDKGVHYGPRCQRKDKSPHLFEIAKERFLAKLAEDQANRDYISATTLHRHLNRKWRDTRKKLLTSYYFSSIVKTRNRKTYPSVLDKIVYQDEEFSNSAEHRHQKIYENKALSRFILMKGSLYLSECGLIIDENYSFLATSPFRLFGDTGIVVVKCPVKAYKKNIQEAIDEKLIPLWKNVSGIETINKSSAWYIEIQGQLHITARSFAYVVVSLESEFRVETIYRDDDFWYDTMESPLVYFYEQVMLKELVDPRKRRKMPARAYNPVTQIFE